MGFGVNKMAGLSFDVIKSSGVLKTMLGMITKTSLLKNFSTVLLESVLSGYLGLDELAVNYIIQEITSKK